MRHTLDADYSPIYFPIKPSTGAWQSLMSRIQDPGPRSSRKKALRANVKCLFKLSHKIGFLSGRVAKRKWQMLGREMGNEASQFWGADSRAEKF